MADLITLTIVLVIVWLLHGLTEAILNRRTSKNHSVLSRLGYDPDQHDLEVTLADGSTITGRADTHNSDPLQDGVLLWDARQADEPACPGTITFVPAHSVTGLAIRNRTDT